MTGEAHGAVVTDPAVNTQVFLWQEGCIFVYIYIFFFSFFLLAVPGLRCCAGFSLVLESRGYSLAAVLRLLVAVASLVAEHGLWVTWASVVVVSRL